MAIVPLQQTSIEDGTITITLLGDDATLLVHTVQYTNLDRFRDFYVRFLPEGDTQWQQFEITRNKSNASYNIRQNRRPSVTNLQVQVGLL